MLFAAQPRRRPRAAAPAKEESSGVRGSSGGAQAARWQPGEAARSPREAPRRHAHQPPPVRP